MNKIIKALKQKDGSFVICLPSNEKLLVNGIPFVTSYNSSKVITCDSIPTIQSITSSNHVVEYRNIVTEEIMSLDDYQDKIKDLTKFRSVDDDGDCYWKPEYIDEEFEYKKFINKYKPVVKEFTDVVAEYEVVIQNKIYSDNPFIIPVSHVGGDITENVFIYDSAVSQMNMVHDVAKKYGYTFYEKHVPSNVKVEGTYTNSDHSGLRFMKISDQYVMNDTWERNSKVVKGTYDECLSAYKRDCDNLNKIFLLDKEKNTKIDAVTSQKILSKLKHIQNLSNKMDVKVSSKSEYRLLQKNINECIETIESNIIEKA
jgi:hypothetical protein